MSVPLSSELSAGRKIIGFWDTFGVGRRLNRALMGNALFRHVVVLPAIDGVVRLQVQEVRGLARLIVASRGLVQGPD